jgi:formyl-CoA transferase
MGISIGDSLAATFAALGALSALHCRQKTGVGQVVDSAIYEAVLNMMESLVTEYDQTGYIRERTGAILPKIAPSNVYPTRDGSMVVIGANQDTVFTRLADAMGDPQLAQQPKFATHIARGENQAELDELVSSWTRTKTREEVLSLMERFGVPAGLIYRAPEMLEDPHFAAREAIVAVAHPDFGSVRMQNVAPKLSRTPGSIRSPSPALGQHNDEVYLELLGLTPQRYAQLKDSGVV